MTSHTFIIPADRLTGTTKEIIAHSVKRCWWKQKMENGPALFLVMAAMTLLFGAALVRWPTPSVRRMTASGEREMGAGSWHGAGYVWVLRQPCGGRDRGGWPAGLSLLIPT